MKSPEHVAQQADIDESKLPKFGTIVGIIMIPLLLIIANSVAKVVPALADIQPVLAFLGEPFMALLWLPSLLCTCWAPVTAITTPSWKRS